jgi:BlaI family transcriptional regulator, penicillinase repressor
VPPKQSATLTEAELRIMDVLWRKGSGTVQQVQDWLPSTLAYNSVLTTIRILEKKGHVKHAKDGRAHVYEPVIGREEATRSEIRHLVSRFFRNSHEALVLNILRDEQIDAEQLKRMRGMLEETENQGQNVQTDSQVIDQNAMRGEKWGEKRDEKK